MLIKHSIRHGLVLALAIAALLAAWQVSAEQKTPAPGDHEINWLFVVNTTGGTYDGKSVTLHNVPPVLVFSDRPDRIWGHMTVSELLPKVKGGPNSFVENPPNSVLSTFREGELPTEATLVMTEASFDGTNLTFTVDVLDGQIPATFGPASLFVDRVRHNAGAFLVGAAVASNRNERENETVVVKEPTVVYHTNPAPAPSEKPSVQSQLETVKRLYDQKLISEQEYEKKRAEILASM